MFINKLGKFSILITLFLLSFAFYSSVEAKETELTNNQVDIVLYERSPLIKKIVRYLDSDQRWEAYQVLAKIKDGSTAYVDARKDIIKEFNKGQATLPKEERIENATINDVPELIEFLQSDSGIKIEKIKVSNKLLPTVIELLKKIAAGEEGIDIEDGIDAFDMSSLDWLFEFVE